MSNNQTKLKLELNEENELSFQMTIEGSDPELSNSKSKVRFLLSENKNDGMAWVYQTSKNSDGTISVVIPSDSKIFSENLEYKGQLEVIIGSHYFVPTEVGIQFVRPLKVEASINTSKLKSKTSTLDEQVNSDIVAITSVEVRQSKKIQKELLETEDKTPAVARKKRKWSDLSDAEKARLKKMALEGKMADDTPEKKLFKEQLLSFFKSSLTNKER